MARTNTLKGKSPLGKLDFSAPLWGESHKNFILAGVAVYGMLGTLFGALIGVALGTILTLPVAIASLVEPWVALLAVLGLPVPVLLLGLVGAIVGGSFGALRGATIAYSLQGGVGSLVVAGLIITLMFLYNDLAGGLALFLIWRSFRDLNLADRKQFTYKTLLGGYLFYYRLVFILFGVIIGTGALGLLGFWANDALNVSLMDSLVRQFAEFLKTFSLDLVLDTSQGSLSAGAEIVRSNDLMFLRFNSIINHLAMDYPFEADGSIASSIGGFLDSLTGEVNLQQGNSIRTFEISGQETAGFLQAFEFSGTFRNVVNGFFIGLVQGLMLGLVLGFVLSISDYWLIRQSQKKKPLSFYIFDDSAA